MATIPTDATGRYIEWQEGNEQKAVDILLQGGKIAVTPTKVGYIIMTVDVGGLQRKFDAKQRSLSKPGVVLCTSLEQLRELAELNPEIEALYRKAWDSDTLLGCVLPWKKSAQHAIPSDGSKEMVMDRRGTSCFVIKYGVPSELIATRLWHEGGKLAFASSANPSGKGNSGKVVGVGQRILERADLIIAADGYVRSIQPHEDDDTRYEQGVMVSMVSEDGTLIPEQKGARLTLPRPTVIRKGLALDRIQSMLSNIFNSWEYSHGAYY